MSASQEANGSMTSNSYKSMQPKFKDCAFDSDKDPKYFRVWTRLLSGIIRNVPGGKPLEQFLDSYLKRDAHTSSTRPAFFLDDAALDLGEYAPPGATMDSSTGDATSRPGDDTVDTNHP